jgi:predicted lipoprotein with Yx(FWY)xxD motif
MNKKFSPSNYTLLNKFIILIILLHLSTSKISLRLTKSLTLQSTDNFLKIKSSPVGEYITDKKGFALYLFENDAPNKSRCTDDCEKTFTPFLAEDVTFPPDVESRLESSLVGLLRRPSGKYQVTYKKLPLYKYKLDTGADDRKGHRKKEFGGLWSLIRPDGTALDSRIGSSILKITNGKGIGMFATGISKILVTPDVYSLRVNITESNSDVLQAFVDLHKDFSQVNSTILPLSPNIKLTPIEKKIISNSLLIQDFNNSLANTTSINILLVSQTFEITSDDFKLIISIANKLDELKTILGNKIKYFVNFSISPDSLSNAKAMSYGLAIKDALENANILLDPLNLSVDSDNPIKSINVESTEMNPINFSDAGLMSLITGTMNEKNFKFNAIMLQMKAVVNYNLKKKTS